MMESNRKNLNKRICIIGAGAAGLTAADTLKALGYTNITVLEKENAAGGKCRSVHYDGRSYELGAGIVAANNRTVLDLAEKLEVSIAPAVYGSDNLFDLETGEGSDDVLSLTEQLAFLWQLLLRYRRLCYKYEKIVKPGFADVDPELCENFADWAEANGIELVGKNFERFFTGFGYGYWEEVPAAYVLKYYDWATLKSYIRRGFFTFPDGIQELWKKLALQHDVHYNTEVRRIDRQDSIVVTTDKGKLAFDELLLTCPLDEALSFLDASSAETELFSKIEYYDYQTYACVLEGFPQQTGFIPAHFSPNKKGHPMFWYKRYDDSDLYTMYVIGDGEMTEETITEHIRDSVEKLGGTLKEVVSVHRWKYFPHVGTQEIRNGFYDQLEHLQGSNHTYYLGELPNFSTVELSAAYAKNLVEQHFQ